MTVTHVALHSIPTDEANDAFYVWCALADRCVQRSGRGRSCHIDVPSLPSSPSFSTASLAANPQPPRLAMYQLKVHRNVSRGIQLGRVCQSPVFPPPLSQAHNPDVVDGLESLEAHAFHHTLGGPSSAAALAYGRVLALSAVGAFG